MKKILMVFTGGTIGSAPDNASDCLSLDSKASKSALIANFKAGNSKYALYADELFEDSNFPENERTHSENMTLSKLSEIIEHIKSKKLENYSGIIVLHGTDTLAYTSSLFSFAFSNISVPMMLVSGNKPLMDIRSNANANFSAAVGLILDGISPNVYVPYRNSDGEVYIHLGNALKQCDNFSDDFFGATESKSLKITDKELFSKCKAFSTRRKTISCLSNMTALWENVLLVYPYTGLDYSHLSLKGVGAVIHGTYHSGTVCSIEEGNKCSLLYLANEAEQIKIPLFVAPAKLDREQYATLFELSEKSSAILLHMTTEAAYTKLILGISCGLCGNELVEYMQYEINNEII